MGTRTEKWVRWEGNTDAENRGREGDATTAWRTAAVAREARASVGSEWDALPARPCLGSAARASVET